MTTTTYGGAPAVARSRDELELEDLAAMSIEALEDVYRAGKLPEPFSVLDGTPKGRMLAIRGPLGRGWVFDRVRALAKATFFPWEGKSFRSHTKDLGEGINRVKLLGNLYRFETRIEPSAIDGKPCLRLDYGLKENPFFIRAIRDELREVAPGLFLGPAMLDGTNPKLVLWFAIDTP